MQRICILMLFMAINLQLSYAQSLSDFLNDSEAKTVFVGLDFSEVKLVGSEGFTDPFKIQDYYFNAWNGLLTSEADKYDVKAAFRKSYIDYELPVVAKGNNAVGYKNLVTNTAPAFLDKSKIQQMVRKYDVTNKEASFGISFIVHSFNKFEEKAYIYAVIFNPKNGQILLHEKIEGKARGFGFRNYWAGAVYDVIKQIEKKEFRNWRKQYIK